MRTLRIAFWLHLLVAVGSLSAAALLHGLWFVVPVFIALGGLWAVYQRNVTRGESLRIALPVADLLLFLFTAAGAVVAILLGTPRWLALLIVVGTLGAWDLNRMLRRLLAGGEAKFSGSLGNAHLSHLLVVEAVGFAAGYVALAARLRLPFWWEVALAVLVFVGLSQLIQHLRAQTGEEA